MITVRRVFFGRIVTLYSHQRNIRVILSFQATGLICFLIGFVTVLCVGNYYRALKAMERQRHKRLARLAGNGNGVVGIESPGSDFSSSPSGIMDEEQQHLLTGNRMSVDVGTRRRPVEGTTTSLLLDVNDTRPRPQPTSV